MISKADNGNSLVIIKTVPGENCGLHNNNFTVTIGHLNKKFQKQL